jgi:hypothetical protein
LLLALPLAGGAALVMHILVDVSLPLGLAALALAGASMWAATWRWAPPALRARLRARVWAGLRAGIVATAAYDLCRYGVVALLAFSFKPFQAWAIFGQLFVGPAASPVAIWAAGAAYHLFNGIGFAVAFALLFRRPTWKLGVVWGVGLELGMATLYPSWLRIAALQEFLAVSAIGHVVYGAVMGGGVQRLLAGDSRAAEPLSTTDTTVAG